MILNTGQWSIERITRVMREQGYIADEETATAIFLAVSLGKPLLVEGPAGVGKTEIAKTLAQALDTRLIRLQCYEGLDAYTALYEWNYPRQMLRIRMDENSDRSIEEREQEIFSEDFLLERPLLAAIRQSDKSPVLLIDELDRADLEFDAFLLEILSEFQVTIPELGTITAKHRPYVIITSNRTRELSDALRRRCLYLWIDYPSFEKELAIVHARLPGINAELAAAICRLMEKIRRLDLDKLPGTAETLDWARALMAMHRNHLDPEAVAATLGVIAKTGSDLDRLRRGLNEGELLVGARAAAGGEA